MQDFISASPSMNSLHIKWQLIYRLAEGGSPDSSAEYILLSHFVRQVMGWVQMSVQAAMLAQSSALHSELADLRLTTF